MTVDIALCVGTNCNLKLTCRRYLTQIKLREGYYSHITPHYNSVTDTCINYWEY